MEPHLEVLNLAHIVDRAQDGGGDWKLRRAPPEVNAAIRARLRV